MSLLTLGTAKEGQRIDDLSLEAERRYMHHYNFPPYSVGETGMMRGPKRRDIGHGALAQRALEPVIPGPEDLDRKSTRLNSSHANISYAVFCLKKKNLIYPTTTKTTT